LIEEWPMAAAKTTEHTEVPSGGHKSFPPFEKETFASQLVWLAITFVVLYVMVAKLGLPRVGGTIAARQGRIDGDLAEASRFKTDSENAMAAYEKALAEARNRAMTLANETHARLIAEADANRKAVEGRLNARLAEAEKSIAATKTAAMTNVRGIAIDTAAAIVARLTGTAPAEAATASAVDAVLKR
jgi:F-type H+-transporting ATPase subunit b